jgi:putative transposase
MKILRTQIHIINKNHRLFKYCDDICFKSKNLYNYANYILRQEFINNNKWISSFDLNKILKSEDVFKEIPAKTSQQIIILLGKNWKSFFKGVKDWKHNKNKYTGKPNLPKYKKKDGRQVVFFDHGQGSFKDNKYYFPRKDHKKIEFIETNIIRENFKLLRIIPYGDCYKIEIIYKKEIEEKLDYNNNYIAIDLGIDNLATLTNNIELQPIVINGRILKSINCYYNKLRSKALSYIGKGTSHKIRRIDTKRNNIINTHFHKISRYIINYCIKNNVENIIIGRNKDWQRGSNLGKKNNQIFVQIPFEDLIKKIFYKAEENGIRVIIISEEYTSKSSFIDDDIIPTIFGDYEFSGRRIKRGLYKSKKNILINSDVNGSYNILRKCIPEFVYNNDRIKGISLYPIRQNIG